MATHLEQLTISSGNSLSSNIRLSVSMVVGIVIDSSTWTSADMTFQGSIDGTTFFNLYDGSDEYAVTVLANTAHKLDPLIFKPWKYVRCRSGTNASAVNQQGTRTARLLISEDL